MELMALGLWMCCEEGPQSIPGQSGWSGLCICTRCEFLDSSIPHGQLESCPLSKLADDGVAEAPLGCATRQRVLEIGGLRNHLNSRVGNEKFCIWTGMALGPGSCCGLRIWKAALLSRTLSCSWRTKRSQGHHEALVEKTSSCPR